MNVPHWMFDSGFLGIFIFVGGWAIRTMRSVDRRIARDESLKRDYPPHRHINGSRIVYPKEYQPSRIESLES